MRRGGRAFARGINPGRGHNRETSGGGRPLLRVPVRGRAAIRREGQRSCNARRLAGVLETLENAHNDDVCPNSDYIQEFGLNCVGFEGRQNVSDKTNLVRFRGFYGIGPAAVAALYKALQKKDGVPPNLRHFLMTLYWLKSYDTVLILSGWWRLHPETIMTYTWRILRSIQSLKPDKVKWEFEKDTIFIISVDGVHCKTYEARKNPTKDVYSHKSAGPALAYELGIAIYESKLVWISGPFPASVHDISIFRNNKPRMFPDEDDPEQQVSLKSKIPEGKMAVGDSGYKGEAPGKISINREKDSKEVRDFKHRVRARHESFNSRIKVFKILDERFRHGKEKHQIAFESVCVLCQFDMENGHPLMEV